MEKLSYILYLIVLTLSILLFGAMHAYVYTLMSLGVLLAAVLLVIKSVRKDQRKGVYQLHVQKTGLHFFFLAILVFLAFQLVPLPPSLISFLSPEAAVVWQKSLPAHALVDGNDIAGSWYSLASYGYPVRMSLIRWIVYGLFFFGLVRVLNSQKRIQSLVYLLLFVGCFEALYGLFQAYSGDAHVLWKSVGNQKSASGTYINRNHFAGLMEMGLLLAAGFAVALMDRKKEKSSGRDKKPSFRARVSALLSNDQWIQKTILILFVGVVMGLGVIFSASRGGIVAAAGGLLIMGLLLVFKKGQKRSGVVLLVLFLITASYSLDIGIDYVLNRFESIEKSYEYRERLARKTMELFGDYTVAGVGIGNFQYAYPRYQAQNDLKGYVRFAHNDWAQFLSEAGIAGFIILLGGLGFYLYSTIRLWRKRSDPFAVGLGIVPIPIFIALGIHSFSDFNLHIPANFLVLVALMAIGYAALHLERHHRRDRMNYRYYALPLKYRGGVALVLILGLIGWTGYASVRHFMAEVYCNTVPNSTLKRDQHPPLEEVAKAISWDPGNAGYWFKLGATDYSEEMETKGLIKESERLRGLEVEEDGWLDEWMMRMIGTEVGGLRTEDGRQRSEVGSRKTEVDENLRNLQIMALERAVERNPFDAQYHLRLGWAYAHLWQEKDYHSKWLPAGDISMNRAAYFAGVKNPRLHVELGNYWTMRSKSVLPNNPLHHEAWAKAVWHYRKAQSIEAGDEGMDATSRKRPESEAAKKMKKEIREYVWNFYPDQGMVNECLNQ